MEKLQFFKIFVTRKHKIFIDVLQTFLIKNLFLHRRNIIEYVQKFIANHYRKTSLTVERYNLVIKIIIFPKYSFTTTETRNTLYLHSYEYEIIIYYAVNNVLSQSTEPG